MILASKVRGKMGDGPDEAGLSSRAMRKGIEASLKRLQTDYLDLYYLHMPDYEVGVEETLETMAELVREGKVRFPAISNYAAWQVTQILWICEKEGYPAPTISNRCITCWPAPSRRVPALLQGASSRRPSLQSPGRWTPDRKAQIGGASHLRHTLRRQQDVS